MWKRITRFNKYCEQLAPNVTRQNLYLVTSEISLKMSSNHKNLKKSRWQSAAEICSYAFSISAIMTIGLNRKRNNTPNKRGVRQGPLYKA